MRIPFRHGETILHFAARRNWTTVCRWLLRLGADVNRTDILDRTALHYAAARDAAETPRLLILYGADLEAKDWKGRSPLDHADAACGKVAAVIEEEISLRHSERVKQAKVLRDRG